MKITGTIILTIIMSGILFSCHTEVSKGMGWEYSSNFDQENTRSDFESIERKVLFSANVWLVVDEPDSANAKIEKITKKYGGLYQSTGHE